MTARRPTGRTLTYDEAAELAGKHVATIYRWVKNSHVREILGTDPTGQSFWGVAETDILTMRDKKWTRRPRPHAAA